MKGLGPARGRFLSDSCDLPGGPQEPLYPLYPHPSYLLSPTLDPYGTLDPHFFPPPSSPTSLPPESLLSLTGQLNSTPYPCLPYSTLEPGPPAGVGGGGIGGGVSGPPLSMGTGPGLGVTSGSATLSGGGKTSRLGGAGVQREGFSTLQFPRGGMTKPRSDSPGRIRHLVHSVQKLFAKSQSLECSAKAANVNGAQSAKTRRRSKSKDRAQTQGPAPRPRSGLAGLWSSEDKLEPAPSAQRPPPVMMTLGRAVSDEQGPPRYFPQGYNTIGSSRVLKTSRSSGELKCAPTLSGPGGQGVGGGARGEGSELKLVKRDSWSTLTLSQARQMCQKGLATLDKSLLKSKSCHQDLAYPSLHHYLQVPIGDWSSTMGPSRGSTEIPCRRMRSGSYVRAMGDLEDSEDSEGSPKPSPKSAARRQSYQKATQHSLSEQLPPRKNSNCWDLGLLQEDLGPLWSPLQSLTSLHRLGSCLPSLSELSTNRSLDNLDSLGCIDGPGPSPFLPDGPGPSPFLPDGPGPSPFLPDGPGPSPFLPDGPGSSPFLPDGPGPSPFLPDGPAPSPFLPDGPGPSPFQPWDQMDFSQSFGTLSRTNLTGQSPWFYCPIPRPRLAEPAGVCFQVPELSYREAICALPPMPPLPPLRPLELPLASCFRSRSQSYIRAIHAGCAQEEEEDCPPPTVHTYSSTTTSTCISTCKKAPPPVPPRTTSKPFISVTVQSSTESAQDTYLDTHPHKGESNGQSGHSNSSDCLTGPPALAPAGDPPQHDILKISPLSGARPEPLPKRKLSSIGIQVDCNPPDQKPDTPPLTRFQSIGVQVEDGWQQSRPSSMASKQEADANTQDLPPIPKTVPKTTTVSSGSQATDPPTHRHQGNGEGRPPRPLTSRTSSASFSLDPALDPSSLPPPEPWLESGPAPSGPAPGASACRRDGHWFLKLLQAETARMEGWCQQMEQETKENPLTEEVLGKIRSAMGSAQLLMSQKFQQFRGLCDQNLNLSANPRPTAQDLAGFWDLLQLSIEDISLKFDELYHLKSNDWKLADSPEKKEEKKQPPPVPKKPSKAKMAASREKAGLPDPSTDKQRQEARKRLMAAKRAASVRQNSATESADSIEIYVPEAQTRL
ncbi:disks large-associated protein 4-like [Conger conger]|uniref:disks large-associated protein 4-like n=1 Tax=Conger conger TaxID=82655 RepID=UPI002A59E9D3|nr:disks large-associated protein 4-like [Conger conger]